MKNTVALLVLFLLAVRSFAADTDLETRLGSIDGAEMVTIESAEGKREAKRGEVLKSGDRIVTDEKTTTTVLNPDGSVLIVGRNSQLEIQTAKEAPQAVGVKGGTIRGIIGKLSKLKEKKPEHKFRLLIRTRAAVMGVRGTDFVLTADATAELTQLHTLEGAVEVAKTETVLVEKGGTLVDGGKTVQATAEAISEPKVFDQAELSAELSKSQPQLEVPAAQPAPEKEPEPEPSPSPSPEPAAEVNADEEPAHRRSAFWSFQVGIRKYEPGELPATQGPNFSWNPTLTLLGEWFGIRGHFGFFTFGGTDGFEQGVKGPEFGGFASFRVLGHFLVEGGPMMQSWDIGDIGGFALGLGWEFHNRLFGLIDRVYLQGFFTDDRDAIERRVREYRREPPPGMYCNSGSQCHGDVKSKINEIGVGLGMRF